MCGFAGYLSKNKTISGETLLYKMANTIFHRGPDDYGSWYDLKSGIGFAHQRLSIIDLSSAGHQPMVSPKGRYVMVFNGEIYNHKKLRTELTNGNSSINWIGSSDTETLLAAFEAWGIEKAIQRCTGMFAIALWDKYSKTLTLIRDRFGEKPLYYGWQGNTFLFGSELKALKAHPEFQAEIDRSSLSIYIRYNYIPSPYSIYQNIKKLMPGNLINISLDTHETKIKQYWSTVETALRSKNNLFKGSNEEATFELENLLNESVSQQMVADVPVGAFLSGGVDSSTIASLMQAQSNRPIKTFSIGFHDKLYNEADHAKIIAKHLGTDHTQMYVSPNDCMNVIQLIPKLYDEPFADSSQIPTFLISSLAKQHVKVVLSGDAGDEIFSGYNRYQISSNFWKRLSSIPLSLRKILANIVFKIPPKNWNSLANFSNIIFPKLKNYSNIGHKIYKGAGVMTSKSDMELYHSLISNLKHPENLVLGSEKKFTLIDENLSTLNDFDLVEKMMILDSISYLPDDILCKVDRASMGTSLESRIPFLNHNIFEFAWSLPMKLKINEDKTKWILREVLFRYVPKKLIERPKMGFTMPIGDWLKGPLKDWAENLLDVSSLSKEGFFDPLLVEKIWKEHLSGKKNWQSLLWSILVFQEWLKANK